MPATPAIQPCNSLDDVRVNIDRVDRAIVPLLAEREAYVRQAARFKPSAAAVVVPARVEQVVARARALAGELGASPAATEKIYRCIIDAMTEVEIAEAEDLHKGHKAPGA